MSINPTGRSGSISLNTNTSTTRQSGRTDFGAQIRNGLGTTAGVIGGAVSTAAPMVPGGAVVSAAVNGALGGAGGGGGTMGAQAGFAGAGDIPFNGPGLSTNTGSKKTGNSQQDLMNQTKDMQEMMQSFNLQYLQLQEKMQGENRSFSTISNVMKTKHDTAKTSISNVR
jgi:hypothetical protein